MADSLPPGKVCFIGCGRGYDAIMFAQKGFEVTAIDFAPSAINAVKDLARKAKLAVNTIENDIFTLAPEYANTYDFIIEQTCFCAINPARRSEYETVVNQLLKPGGLLIGLWFPLDKSKGDGGPPWGTTIEEVKSIFKDGWKIEKEDFPDLSIGPRKGREKLIVFSKT